MRESMLHKLFLRYLFLVVVLFHFTLATNTFGLEKPTATEQLRPFLNQVVSILTDEKMHGDANREKRRELVMQLVHKHFDFYEMSRRVYGKPWLELSVGQKKTFVGLFTRLLEHAYIGKIEDYSRQTVEFGKERQKGNLAEVQTVLVDGNVSLPVSYLMTYKNNRWVIFDVAVERISIARNYREQFRQVLKTGNYEDLIRQLENKVEILEGK